MTKKREIWDFLFWFALVVLFLWALGKAFGVIKSPVWVESIPIFSMVFMAGALWQKVNNMFKDVEEIKDVINGRFTKLENEHSLAMNGKLKIRH